MSIGKLTQINVLRLTLNFLSEKVHVELKVLLSKENSTDVQGIYYL